MRCQCCNKNLTDYESVLRNPNTMEFLDICTRCLKDIPIDPLEPSHSLPDVDYDFEEEYFSEDDNDL